jgi:hypothetical protein
MKIGSEIKNLQQKEIFKSEVDTEEEMRRKKSNEDQEQTLISFFPSLYHSNSLVLVIPIPCLAHL